MPDAFGVDDEVSELVELKRLDSEALGRLRYDKFASDDKGDFLSDPPKILGMDKEESESESCGDCGGGGPGDDVMRACDTPLGHAICCCNRRQSFPFHPLRFD